MSFDRDHAPQPVILPPTTPQYAIDQRDEPYTSTSFNTMPNPPSDSPLVTRLQIYSTSLPKAWISPICGAGAGLASGIVTCPLDVIKTKLQAQGGFATKAKGQAPSASRMYRGMIGTGSVIWKEEGVRGMYRGLGPMLMGYLPTWAVYLTVYENTRDFYFDASGSWWVARCYSSLTAGACSTVLTNPIWVIKTRLMSQSTRGTTDGMRAPWHYTSTLDAARKMYKAEGIRSFYSGLTPALLGLTHVAVQFPLYEWFKMKFTGYGMGEHPKDGNSHFVGISAATFLSKVCASTATYPHEGESASPRISHGRPLDEAPEWCIIPVDRLILRSLFSAGCLLTCRSKCNPMRCCQWCDLVASVPLRLNTPTARSLTAVHFIPNHNNASQKSC